jgi:hypothetical protein
MSSARCLMLMHLLISIIYVSALELASSHTQVMRGWFHVCFMSVSCWVSCFPVYLKFDDAFSRLVPSISLGILMLIL